MKKVKIRYSLKTLTSVNWAKLAEVCLSLYGVQPNTIASLFQAALIYPEIVLYWNSSLAYNIVTIIYRRIENTIIYMTFPHIRNPIWAFANCTLTQGMKALWGHFCS